MDAALLARLQFAFIIGFHFLFVPLSMGLSLFMVWAERRHYRTRSEEDRAASDFWIRLFTTIFAIGVATGITMEFAFGMNWAEYSRFVGDVFGPPLAAEGIFSFFLESTFLGVLLFGRGRVSPRFYYVAAWLVLIAAHLSALWILVANSWQQTPAGYEVIAGRAVLTDFWAAVFNPSTVPRVLHTVTATWIAGAFATAGVAAYYLRLGLHTTFARRYITAGLVVGVVVSLAMPLVGDMHTRQVAETQPAKLATFEGLFQTENGASLSIFGIPDPDKKTVHLSLGIPNLLSFLLTDSWSGEVAGLDQTPEADRPPMQLTYQSYHLMVGLGFYFIALAAAGLYLLYRRRLEQTSWYLRLLTYSAPLPILASELGWVAAEVGRQPWIVQGELRTTDAVSASVPAGQIGLTLTLFLLIYALLLVAWIRIVSRLVAHGPATFGPATPEAAPSEAITSANVTGGDIE